MKEKKLDDIKMHLIKIQKLLKSSIIFLKTILMRQIKSLGP